MSLSSHELARLLLEKPDQPEVMIEDPGAVIDAEVTSYGARGTDPGHPCVLLETE